MRFKLIVTEDAENDIEQAMDWYENKQTGLGTRYVLAVKACIKLIIKNPFSFVSIYKSIRKANTKKFPYSLYYRVNDAEKLVTVFAVIHGFRSEEIRKQRIDNIITD